jgi:uncharacterized membrane protein YbhN (UPF0104 family)
LTKQQKKILSHTIKASILVLAIVFIYYKLTDNTNLKNFIELVNELSSLEVWITITIIFILMLANWFLECLKWKFLIHKIEPISIKKSIESVFCGLTWAVFTPNRIGEYGGRIFFLSSRKRLQGVVAMSVGQIAQMVITNVAGALAFLWFIYNYVINDLWVFVFLSLLISIFCIGIIVFYFNIHWMNNLLMSIKFLRRYKAFLSVLTRYSLTELSKVMLYSVSRFVVFTIQYLLIINLLVPEIHFIHASLLVFILFFVQSALPSLDLLDIGVRSMTATYFFSFVTEQEIAIMAATALIWLVNLIIPAIMGSFFVFKLNFFGNNN